MTPQPNQGPKPPLCRGTVLLVWLGLCSLTSYYMATISAQSTVRGQNFSSDALFTPKMDIFKQTILNTAYIKTLEIFLSARESLSIQISISRSVGNQSRLHGS